jgi:hypothetical protein
VQRRQLGLLATVCAAVVFVVAASDAKAPSVSFDVHPTYVGCVADQPPVRVTVAWHIVHPLTSATIAGTVDKLGNPQPPVSISTKRGRRGVIGKRKVYMPCVSSAQTLVLTAVGPGGTTTRVLTLNENHAD